MICAASSLIPFHSIRSVTIIILLILRLGKSGIPRTVGSIKIRQAAAPIFSGFLFSIMKKKQVHH
jgi:hypothetical protein